MPNHITNIVAIRGGEQAVKEAYAFIANPESDCEDQRLFDFNKVLPMPESLDIPAPTDTECLKYAIAAAKDRFSRTEEERRLFNKAEANPKKKAELLRAAKAVTANLADHGYANWYDWRCDKWGTKWNCYEAERLEDGAIRFLTAWTMPDGVLRELSRLFPSVSVEAAYADEDLFHNCGRVSYSNGEVAERQAPASESREAFDIVMEVMPELRGVYEWDAEKGEPVRSVK